MAKKKEELVQCKKCGKMEARVKHVIFDDDGSVYTQHPWMLGMIFMVVGIALIPRIRTCLKSLWVWLSSSVALLWLQELTSSGAGCPAAGRCTAIAVIISGGKKIQSTMINP